MSKSLLKTSSIRLFQKKKWLEVDERLKPFGFCCSMDRFDPLTKYNQRIPPYKSSLTAITSVNECPVTKIQAQYFMPRQLRNKKKLKRILEIGNQQQLRKQFESHHFDTTRDNGLKWYLEDEIALAKNIFWTKKQNAYNEEGERVIKIASKKIKKRIKHLLDKQYPRWYQDFSPNQVKILMNLENVMRIDYEETTTKGTQKSLMAIGVVSTFFKLDPITIKELHKSCNLNGADFLRKIYKILTGNDFLEEGYKKYYNCNERIILSAIAFLTLPETVKILHTRLPKVIMPELPSKPKPPMCLPRLRDKCPYKEELFKRPDWASYRNELQKWQKQCKLLPVPKINLPFQKYKYPFLIIPNDIKIRKQDKDTKYHEKELPKISSTKLDRTSRSSIGKRRESKRKISKIITTDVPLETKTLIVPKPPRACQKSWLGEKDAHYVISGATYGDPTDPIMYEISGIANVTPSNSDERFFAVLKRGKPKKVFPSGRENLSKNWQEWLQNADEEYRQIENKADELIQSMHSIKKLAFPEPVCDSCCLCRQTRKTREKMKQTKMPHLLIDNVMQNEEKKYIVGSTAMHSPGPSPTDSPLNLLEMIASQDEIKTNMIINDVTYDNGKIQYHISGVQKDKICIPSQVPDRLIFQPVVRNVPPCACAIPKQISEMDHVSPSVSKDNIFWTKDEGLCPGKKYRPNEPGAYSCKKHPGDKSCRRNPFIKEILKMKRKEKEEQKEDGKKEKAKLIDTKKEAQTIQEKKKDKFIPNFNPYPAYDHPWNILRTAPSPKVLKTDYENTLKLTSPVLPTTFTSPVQKRQNNPFSSNRKPEKFAKNIKNRNISNKTFHNISSNLSKKIEKHKKEKDKIDKNINQDENIASNKIIINEKDIQSLSTTSNKIQNEITNPHSKLSSHNKIIKQQSENVDKTHKYGSMKKDKKKKKKLELDKIEHLDSRKLEMARLKNMLKSPTRILDNVQPTVLPWELQATHQSESEKKIDEISNPAISTVNEEESYIIENGPYGWRTKSEQELPAKKTLAYLCEPDYPLETVAIRPGGRPCKCRENRNKKKIFKYNVGGLVEKKGRGTRKTKLKEENRVIEGVVYFTPPISPRRSDEYIPEYDLLESPYDICVDEENNRSKLIKKYSGPKSLVEKTRKKPKSCSCSIAKDADLTDQKKDIEETRQKLIESKSPEERWILALKDAALTDYFTQPRDKTLCWTSCRKFARHSRPRRLKVMKPVCECKNERKIVERNEERNRWKMRQQRLKAAKKQAFMHVVDTSRPMVEETKLIISGASKVPEIIEGEHDVEYCISGISKDLSISPPQQILDGLKMSTPLQTPEPSKEDIPIEIPHRHWSPMNIPPGPLPRKHAILKEDIKRRQKAIDEALMLIYGDKQDACRPTYRIPQERYDHEIYNVEKYKKSCTNVEEIISKTTIESRSSSKKIDNSSEHQNASQIIVNDLKETTNKIDYQPDLSYKKIIDKTKEKIDEQKNQTNDNDDKKHASSQSNLTAVIKAELKKMSDEGYMFAKLPKCYLMPQLRDWVMHRKGIAFSDINKKNIMLATVLIWHLLQIIPKPRIKTPSMHMTQSQLRKLNFDQAEKTKKKIKKKREIFQSKVRKARVSYARTMWGTMESGKFPCEWFKKAFFTYMASKEADGYVYRPWLTSEFCGRNPDFSCHKNMLL